MEKCLMEWKPINSRLMKISMKGKRINITMIQCYMHWGREQGWGRDQACILRPVANQARKHTMLWDENSAKVGNDNTNHGRAMGKEGYGSVNNNGERLLEFCTTNDLVIGETLFFTMKSSSSSGASPVGETRNRSTIGKWRRSLENFRVRRGAVVGSDHHLVNPETEAEEKWTWQGKKTALWNKKAKGT